MNRLTTKEWDLLYRSVWRKQYVHLSKEGRGRLVLACRSKVRYSSRDEARTMLRVIQPKGKLQLCVYSCPLGQGTHITNRRHVVQHRKLPLLPAAPAGQNVHFETLKPD